jgi:hypothetical protein
MAFIRKLLCALIGHNNRGDDTWGGYGHTCQRCGKNDYSIHDM